MEVNTSSRHDALGEQDRVFVVVAVPRHERDERVAAERQVAEIGRRTVGDDVALVQNVADGDQRALVDAGVLVRTLELLQPVDIDAGLRRIEVFGGADNDTGRIDLVDDAAATGRDRSTGVTGDDRLHAGADERRFRPQQRHGLTLHVRAHERAVGVVVLKERNERGRDRNELLRRNVHQVDLVARREHDFAGVTADDELFLELAVGVQHRVGLCDVVLRLFHRRQVDDVRRHLAVDDLAVRAFDEAVLVDAGEGRKRVDQTDVRAFRRFDRADTAVVGRMNVADFEAGALAGQTARAKSRETALVGDFRQRVHLVHELRQLRGAEEFANRGSSRLGVDQVLRHDRVDLDRRHAFLDRALHAQQAETVLVLHQLADRTDAAVAEVVDVVDLALAVAQVDQHLDHGQDVVLAQDTDGVGDVEVETHVHLDAADGRQVVALGVEEQRLEHGFSRIHRRRLARTHDAVDVEQRVLTVLVLVDGERVADVGADVDVVDVENRNLVEAGGQNDRQGLLVDLVAGFEIDLTGREVDDVLGEIVAVQIVVGRLQSLEALFGELLEQARGQLLAALDHDFAGVGVDHVGDGLLALQRVRMEGNAPAFAVALVERLRVEGRQDLFAVHAERHQQRRHRDLAATVDAGVHDVLGVELDVEPGAAIGDDAGGKQQLAGRMALALVVVEEHARRTVHLRDDDALGAVDDEGTVVRS